MSAPDPPNLSPSCSIDEQDVIWIDFSGITHVSVSHTLEVYRWHIKTDNTPKAVINVALEGQAITMDALSILEKPPVSDMIICSAVIVKSKLLQYFSRLYLPLHNPPYPVRLFGNKEDALAWVLKTRAKALKAKGEDAAKRDNEE